MSMTTPNAPQLCQRLQTRTSRIVVVDVFTGLHQGALMFDRDIGPHPNAIGGQFMCDKYFPVITSILNGVIPNSAPLLPPWPGPPGYILCSFTEGGWSVNFPTPVNVAYGTSGHYYFFSNVSGNYSFNNGLGDPDPGAEKFGYVQQNGPTFTSSTRVSNHQVQMQLTGVTNESYTLQVATNLAALNEEGSVLGTNGNSPPNGYPVG